LLLSMAAHAYTLWRFFRTPDEFTVQRQVNELNLLVLELLDRVDSWQKRDRTRMTREARRKKADGEAEGVDEDPAAVVPPAKVKDRLRAIVYQRKGG